MAEQNSVIRIVLRKIRGRYGTAIAGFQINQRTIKIIIVAMLITRCVFPVFPEENHATYVRVCGRVRWLEHHMAIKNAHLHVNVSHALNTPNLSVGLFDTMRIDASAYASTFSLSNVSDG